MLSMHRGLASGDGGIISLHTKRRLSNSANLEVRNPPNQSRLMLVGQTAAMTALLIVLWSLTHRDFGYGQDGILYAFQALARLRPSLDADLYLKYGSPDKFTIFSPVYAEFARSFGLTRAGEILLASCAATFLIAAWNLARSLGSRRSAWFATAFLILTVGAYGAGGIFRFSEEFLTARSAGEALTLVALALHFAGHRKGALLTACVALVMHPLMAFPGLLLLLCLWGGLRNGAVAAIAGILAALALSLWAAHGTPPLRILAVIDPTWLEVVRERSQFLFLQLWRPSDWLLNARPFLCLSLSAWAITEPRMRQVSLAALLVGATGLAIAAIASLIGPSALLLQGQAWRWVWITSLFAVLLLPETVIQLWRDARLGPLCAVLLVAAWTFPPIDGTKSAAAALLLAALNSRVETRHGRRARQAAFGVAAIVLLWVVGTTLEYLIHPTNMDDGPMWVQAARAIVGLGLPGLLCVLLLDRWLTRSRSTRAVVIGALPLTVLAAYLLPFAVFSDTGTDWPGLHSEYSDWLRHIPPSANVYVADGHDVPMFTWFTLQRPDYLSTTQSAGVVFSRSIALAVRRRSKVLRPYMSADWRLLDYSRHDSSADASRHDRFRTQPITSRSLIELCSDPRLNYVIAPRIRGVPGIVHEGPGLYRHWSLYDCAEVSRRDPYRMNAPHTPT